MARPTPNPVWVPAKTVKDRAEFLGSPGNPVKKENEPLRQAPERSSSVGSPSPRLGRSVLLNERLQQGKGFAVPGHSKEVHGSYVHERVDPGSDRYQGFRIAFVEVIPLPSKRI